MTIPEALQQSETRARAAAETSQDQVAAHHWIVSAAHLHDALAHITAAESARIRAERRERDGGG